MLREFVKLVNEAVDAGFERGINLFMESVEHDLAKNEVICESGGVDSVLMKLFLESGVNLEEEIDESEIDDEKLELALKELKKEGLLG